MTRSRLALNKLVYTMILSNQTTFSKSLTNLVIMPYTGFPLYFGIKIQGLSRTLKLHFHGPILDGSLQHGQY